MRPEQMTRLIRLSQRMRWLCFALVIIVLVAGVFTGASWFFDRAALGSHFDGTSFSPDTVGIAKRLLIIAINIVTLIFTCRGLLALANLFASFSRAEILNQDGSRLLRKAGFRFLIAAIYGIAARTASILLLTLGNPPGEKQLAVGVGSNELFAILLAGVLFVIGHVLSIAAALEEENKGFI